MQLLVSVRHVSEVAAALAGGADIIDAKEPGAGALGAVGLSAFREICAAAERHVPVSAALGDIVDTRDAEAIARAYASAGASFVKVGFAGTTDPSRVQQVVAAAVAGASCAPSCAVVAVAYADADRIAAIEPRAVLECTARTGARAVLLDTASKSGASLRELVTSVWLRKWVADAHAFGLSAALAGKLTEDDVAFVHQACADIIGVRGAACRDGRLGVVSTAKVRQLRNRIEHAEFERAEARADALSRTS
jgi:uncharacterized protein (UPF0264 family)